MKDMSLTLAGLLVLVFAVLPGVPGEKLYQVSVGSDWREDPWQRILRLLVFSLFGLVLYAVIAPYLGAPPPTYLSPTALEKAASDPVRLNFLFVALLGHFGGAAVAGLLSGLCVRAIAHFTSATAFVCAWDHFVHACVKGHWVVVGLTNGEAYSGYVDVADVSVSAEQRDLILREPAQFDSGKSEYIASKYQSLFIPGNLVASIAVIHDPMQDKRIIPVGELVFPKENEHVQGPDQGRKWDKGGHNREQGRSSASGTDKQADDEHTKATSDTERKVV